MTGPDSLNARLHRHRFLLTAIGLMLAAWALYAPSLKYGFVYFDDVRILRAHPELYGQPTLAADLKGIFVTYYPREEPLLLRDVVWAIDSRLFGFPNAFGYHLTNVLLHGVVVALLFAFLLANTRRYGFSLITTVAYLLLAVHVEPVAWIMGLKDILSTLFMLLALGAQTVRLTTENRPVRYGCYFATLVFLVAGLFSKISVLTFPLVLFLHAIFFPYLRWEHAPAAPFPWRNAVRECLLMVPALAVSCVIYVWYQRILAQMGLFERGYTAHGLAHLWNLLMVDPLVLWVYLRQIFLPQHLSVLYSWPGLQSSYSFGRGALAIATVTGLFAAGCWIFRRRKDLFFFFGAALVLMVPYLNLVYIGIWVADRYVYFASICVIAIAVALGETVWQRSQKGFRVFAQVFGGVLLAANLFQTATYQTDWRDGESLWQYHITLPQPHVEAYNNLAAYYYADFTGARTDSDTQRMAKDLEKMKIVVDAGMDEFWPDRKQPAPAEIYFLFFLRSLVEEAHGDTQAAVNSLLTADQLHPGFDSTVLNLSRLYRELARSTKDSGMRQTYLRAARDRFAEYLKLDFHDRPAPDEARKEMESLETEMSAKP